MCKSPALILYFSIISDAGSSQTHSDPQSSSVSVDPKAGTGQLSFLDVHYFLVTILSTMQDNYLHSAYTVLGNLRSQMMMMTVYGQVCTHPQKAEFYIRALSSHTMDL